MSDTGFGCLTGEGLTVCSPRGNRYRTVQRCFACKTRRRMLVTTYMWYGPRAQCCHCGNEWDDGYRLRQTRRQRERRVPELRAEWQRETGTKATALAWIMAQLDASGVAS